MASIAQPQSVVNQLPSRQTGIWSWITTVDHKRIGMLYGVAAFFFLLFGGVRGADHSRPARQAGQRAGRSPTRYNELFTMHGTTMIFLVVMPMSVAFFNYSCRSRSARATSRSPA